MSILRNLALKTHAGVSPTRASQNQCTFAGV
jgi:hypothetical protein